MKADRLVPAPSEAGAFDFAAIRALPDAPGCYVLTNAGNEILYIGQAVSIRNRLLQHLDAGKHHALTEHGRVSLVRLLGVDEPSALSAHERGWLNQCELADGCLPPLNKVHAPTG